jgi:hypothetical protein
MSARMRTVVSVSGRSMIGPAMPPMHSAILRSRTKNRRLPSRKSEAGKVSRHHAARFGRRSVNLTLRQVPALLGDPAKNEPSRTYAAADRR